MKNSLLYFSISILVLNLLFIIIAVANNFVGFFGALVGGSAAILTDPVILVAGILGGVALATQRIKFAVIALVVGSIIAAVVVHFFLDTTRFIVDVVRVNVFLIIPSIFVVVASFFTPKSKDSAKKVSVKKVKAKNGSKVNKDSNKGIRSILLIIIISVGTFFLVIPNSRESLVGENVTQYVLKPFFTSSRVLKCSYTSKIYYGENHWKCKTIDINKWKATHNVERKLLNFYLYNKIKLLNETPLKEEVTKYDPEKTVLENNIKWNRDRKTGTYYLQKKYRTNNRALSKIIDILHPILLIVLIFYTWRLRFCITGITVSLFKKIKAAI